MNDTGYTCDRDRASKHKTFKTDELPRQFSKFEAENQDEPDVLQGEGMKIIIPSSNIDNWTKLEEQLGLKLPEHIDTLID